MPEIQAALEYYARPGLMTDPGEHVRLLDGLPASIPELAQMVQGLLLHIFWAERYGVKLSGERKSEVGLRTTSKRLASICAQNAAPLTVARPLTERSVGNCRDFSVTLCAMLRHQGIPARARCGFAHYFNPPKWEDHWVCEYWNATQERWVMVDPQLDRLQREALRIDFDPLDMPPGRFIPGGSAWQACRAGQADPEDYGIFTLRGLWFIRGDLVRDVAALNKVELLPWDSWGLADKPDKTLTPDDLAALDRAAALSVEGTFDPIRALYEGDDRFKVPPVIRSYPTGPEPQIVQIY